MGTYVMCILIDNCGKTIGAEINFNGRINKVSTESLIVNKDILKLDNAIIDKNGYVRGKNGTTLRKCVINTRPNAKEQYEQNKAHKLINQPQITLYHGNKDKTMIPRFGIGSSKNDYGKGLYTSPDKELAKEWAWGTYSYGSKGYLHTYSLSNSGLNILDLTEKISLHWIAELLQNRTFNLEGKEVAKDNKELFLQRYKLDTSNYDVIVGYRADDSYFKYAEDFISGIIYKETIENALRLGQLGIQVFIKSPKAFSQLSLISVEEVPKTYEQRYTKRDTQARRQYEESRRNQKNARVKETVHDVLRRQ